MPRDGAATREKILNAAEGLMMDHGYGGTSVDSVIERAGITKGAFFYHFKTKADLARAVVERYAAQDIAHYHSFMERAEKLSRDPLQQLLIFIGFGIEMMENLDTENPGCLYASYVYQSGLLEPEALNAVRESIHFWRRGLAAKIREVTERYPSRMPVAPESLADQITVAFEGGYVLARSVGERGAVARALEHYRNYVELLFAPAP